MCMCFYVVLLHLMIMVMVIIINCCLSFGGYDDDLNHLNTAFSTG
jgi:hypothetical protein